MRWAQSCFLGSAPRLAGSEDSAGGQARKMKPNGTTRNDHTSLLHSVSLPEIVSNEHQAPGTLLKIQYFHLM